jgi:hypothetical protein
MKRQNPIELEIKKYGEHWAVYAEQKLVAVAVYRKGAVTLEALLRGLIRYTSRNLFRQALEAALTAKETDADQKPAKEQDAKPAAAKKKGGQGAGKPSEAATGAVTETTATAASMPEPSVTSPPEQAPTANAEPTTGPAATSASV